MSLAQPVKPSYWEGMEEQLKDIFYRIVFEPVSDIIRDASAQMGLGHKALLNADDNVVRDALRAGKIQYGDGVFSGQFSAVIARGLRRLGAAFSAREKVYKINPSLVPGWVKAEAGVYHTIAKEAHREIEKVLGYVEDGLDQLVEKNPVKAGGVVAKFEADFNHVAKSIQVHPQLNEESRRKLAEDYTENMKLWINKFSEEAIEDLREIVEANAQTGYRFDRLIEKIEVRYGVAQAKAKFLARQETALFMSKFRQGRFKEAGVTRYRWSTAHDERVRSDHKHLNGRVFSYDQPPIVDQATGRKANPGEDFNCRCVDVPILDPVFETA